MPSEPIRILTAGDPDLGDRSLDAACAGLSLDALLGACEELDGFRRRAKNHYERVRALFFLNGILRFHVLPRHALPVRGHVPVVAWRAILERRFEEALDALEGVERASGPSEALVSARAEACRALGFQTLADQVRSSVRSHPENAWMFAVVDAAAQPLCVRAELRADPRPRLRERTPVRMDLTHSGWSDIFFLAMDRPEWARVLNASIDLAVRGRDARPRPPVEAWLEVIDEPVLRLTSVDLEESVDLRDTREVFDFAGDHLGLLRAGVVASGLVPPGLEDSGSPLRPLLERLVGPGRGLAVTSVVHGIPKGSRLAVSTTLLAALIAVCMRATGQTERLEGALTEGERRLVCARAILGEWLGGSGGGWQDSGGLWPGLKRIGGALAREGDPEFGTSRGRLVPDHDRLGEGDVPADFPDRLARSLVLVHGGMAQDVGPVLEMVTERYLLRSEPAWSARRDALELLDEVEAALRRGDVRALGAATHRNFHGPIRTIIPWATNLYTERLIERVERRFGGEFLGFWMLGGMAGGGMGFLFDAGRREEGAAFLATEMSAAKRELEHSVPFAMEPVVYDFAFNDVGTRADLGAREIPRPPSVATPRARGNGAAHEDLDGWLERLGFDVEEHERIRSDLRAGRIGLAANRLPADCRIEDADADDVFDARGLPDRELVQLGRAAIRAGEVALVTLAGGAGSRWSGGAGVAKALAPFARLGGAQRTFLEAALAKSRVASERHGGPVPHVVTTGHLSDAPLRAVLSGAGGGGPLFVSGPSPVGLRLVPTVRDLRFAAEERAVQRLDERAQRVRESMEAAWIRWAEQEGEGSDYRANEPRMCVHPVGHGHELASALANGTLARLLEAQPSLRTLLVHNIDTLGLELEPGLLGLHRARGHALDFELVVRRFEDEGGGLARVDGRPRLVEGLALPSEEDALRLSYYNTLTTWVDVDAFLERLGLDRASLTDAEAVRAAARAFVHRLPVYVTLREAKRRFGHGHEDVFPLAQYERLWGDVTALEDWSTGYLLVPRVRGQQLKVPAQLDPWLRDGSADRVAELAGWS